MAVFLIKIHERRIVGVCEEESLVPRFYCVFTVKRDVWSKVDIIPVFDEAFLPSIRTKSLLQFWLPTAVIE